MNATEKATCAHRTFAKMPDHRDLMCIDCGQTDLPRAELSDPRHEAEKWKAGTVTVGTARLTKPPTRVSLQLDRLVHLEAIEKAAAEYLEAARRLEAHYWDPKDSRDVSIATGDRLQTTVTEARRALAVLVERGS